jgi:hypothetical protein
MRVPPMLTRFRAVVALASLVAPTALMAQAELPRASPFSPGPGTYAYDYNAPNLTFAWDHYYHYMNQLPTNFLLCIEPAAGLCTPAIAIADVLPGELSSSPLNDSNGAPLGNRYRLTPTIPDNRLDDAVTWSVAACSNGFNGGCRTSLALPIVVSTAELEAHKHLGNVLGQNYIITAHARNLGSRDSRPFNAKIAAWEVIGDYATGKCVTDPNAITINDATRTWLIDATGVSTQLSQVRRIANRYVVPGNVVAIVEQLPPYIAPSKNVKGIVLPASTAPQSVGQLSVHVPAASRPQAIASALYLDTGAKIYEVDESNNNRADCEVVW